MSETRASIEIETSVTGAESSAGKLDLLQEKAKGVGTETEKSANKAEKGLSRYKNALINTIAAAQSMGNPVDTQLIKASLNDKDITSLQALVSQARQAYDAEQQRKEAVKAAADAVEQATKQQNQFTVALDKSIAKTQALIAAQSGEKNQQANQITNLARQQGVTLSAGNQGKVTQLTQLENQLAQQQTANQQTLAAAKQVAAQEKAIADQIQRLTASFATTGMSAADAMLYKIQQQGLPVAQFQPAIDNLRQVESQSKSAAQATKQVGQQMMANGMTAKQYAAALRGVPAQFTDIVVSLQGGQAPLTVLLQQGGQLKDMFGGVGGAAKALGSYVLSLINPFTVFGTALATVGIAAYQGADESQKLQKSLIQTGYAAGVTRDQLEGIIRSVGDTTGEFGKARDAAMAFSKVFADINTDTARLAVQAIADTATVTGEKIEDIGARFEALGRSPVEAAMKLNENLNILDVNTLKTVASLEKQGRTTEALAVLMNKYADEVHVRAGQVVANAGWMEQAWYGVRNAIMSAWDALKGLGRAQSVGDEIKEIEGRLASYRNRTDEGAAEDIRIAQQNLALAKERLKNEENIAKAGKEQAKAVKAWYKGYQKGGQRSSGRNRKSGAGKTTSPEVSAYQNLEKSILQKNEAVKEELKYGDKLTEAQKLRIKIESNAVDAKKKLSQEQKVHLLGLVDEFEKNELILKQQKNLTKATEDTNKHFDKTNDSYKSRIDVLGMTSKETEKYKDTEGWLLQKQRELTKSFLEGDLSVEGYQKALKDAEEKVDLLKNAHDELQKEENNPYFALRKAVKEYKEEAEDVATSVQSFTQTTMSAMEDSLTSFFTTGKLKANDFFESILQSLARLASQKIVANLFNGLLDGFFGASGSSSSSSKGSSFGGGKAVGGHVNSGTTYLVGEKGPELFVPSQSGTIVPNNQIGTGTGGFNIQISHKNEGTPQQVSASGADFDGRNLIIKIVTQDIANDGMISRTMSKTFGMRRAAGAM